MPVGGDFGGEIAAVQHRLDDTRRVAGAVQGSLNGWMDGRMIEWIDEWISERMNEWTSERMN